MKAVKFAVFVLILGVTGGCMSTSPTSSNVLRKSKLVALNRVGWEAGERSFVALFDKKPEDIWKEEAGKRYIAPAFYDDIASSHGVAVFNKDQQIVGYIWKPTSEQKQTITVERVASSCGKPYADFGMKRRYYGRIGYESEDGQTISKLILVTLLDFVPTK